MTDKWLDHARMVYLDCIKDGMGMFAIAELLAPQEEGRLQWTEPELIEAMARQLKNEAGHNTQQRSAEILDLAHQGRNRPKNKQNSSINSPGSDMRIHRRAGPDICQPGQARIRPGHNQASCAAPDKEAVRYRIPGVRQETI